MLCGLRARDRRFAERPLRRVHAGWRGAVENIAGKTVRCSSKPIGQTEHTAMLALSTCSWAPISMRNASRPVRTYVPGLRPVSEPRAYATSRMLTYWRLSGVGVVEAGAARDRIVDAGACTKCAPDRYFCYRASGGTCGRMVRLRFEDEVSHMGFDERYHRTLEEVAACARRRGGDPREVRWSRCRRRSASTRSRPRSRPARMTSVRTVPMPLRRSAGICQSRTWHFIGNIQSRRIPDIVRDAVLVHSLYQERHVHRFEAAALLPEGAGAAARGQCVRRAQQERSCPGRRCKGCSSRASRATMCACAAS